MNVRIWVGFFAAAAALPASVSAVPNVSFGTRLLVNEANIQVGNRPSMALTPDTDDDIDAFVTDADSQGRYAATVQVDVDLPPNGFYFAHNLIGCGKSKSDATTVLAIDLTNNNSDPISGFFTSKILEGHAAVRNAPGFDSTTHYFFGIFLDGQSSSSMHGVSTTTADGPEHGHSDTSVNPAFAFQGGGLNNYSVFNPDTSIIAADWGETNIGLAMTLAPGQTRTVTYALFTSQEQFGPCADGRTCQASQLLFADPRDTGGTQMMAAQSLALAQANDPDLPRDYCTDVGRENPIIGRRLGPGKLIEFGFIDGPLPPNPPYTPPSYAEQQIVVAGPAGLGLLGFSLFWFALRRRG